MLFEANKVGRFIAEALDNECNPKAIPVAHCFKHHSRAHPFVSKQAFPGARVWETVVGIDQRPAWWGESQGVESGTAASPCAGRLDLAILPQSYMILL